MANSEDVSDKAFAELYELFSKPIKSAQKPYRTYLLTFENGEPIFMLSEASRIMEEIFEEIFAPDTNERPHHAAAWRRTEPLLSALS